MKKQAHYRMKTAGVEEFLSRMLVGKTQADLLRRGLLLNSVPRSALGGAAVGAISGAATAGEGNRMRGAVKGGLIGGALGTGAGAIRGHVDAKKLLAGMDSNGPISDIKTLPDALAALSAAKKSAPALLSLVG